MTVEIPLTQGRVALIDDEDLPLVSGRKWNALKRNHTFYAACTARAGEVGITSILMHRLILSATPGQLVDHADGNGLNNQRSNIRLCTTHQNSVNRKPLGKHSQYKGIRITPSGTWQAAIGREHLGTFLDERDAAKAYDDAARARYGEFARLNFG